MTLHELQRQFLDGLLLQQQDTAILHAIAQTDERPAQELLEVYRDSVFGGLSKALAAIYPVCCKLVGEAFFNAMLSHYILQHHSTSPDLDDYGSELPEFIARFAPADDLPYLPDVAKLEWAWHRVFNAMASSPLNLQRLAELSEAQCQRIVFSLAPTAVPLQSNYPVHHIWHSNQHDYTGEKSVSLDEGGDKLLIWREGLAVHIDPVTDAQWLLLHRVAHAVPFGQLCVELSRRYPDTDIGELLAMAIRRGWLADFSLTA